MASDVFVSEGRLITERGPLGRLEVGGPVLSGHDALYFYPERFQGTAGFVSQAATDNAPSNWAFDQTTVERIKWQWVPPTGWGSWTMRMGWLSPVGSGGNVVWRYKHLPLYLGGSAVDALTTINTTAALAAPAAFGTAWRYDEIATNIAVTLGAFGEAPIYQSVIDRFATDATDTLAADAAVFVVTVTRQPQG